MSLSDDLVERHAEAALGTVPVTLWPRALSIRTKGRLWLKDMAGGRLAAAVRAVAAGETLLDPALTQRLVERFVRLPPPGSATPDALTSLTPRELDVMREVARGRSNHEIATRLYLSDATIKTHVASILKKLGLRDRIQVVVCAYETGLIEPGHVA